jgi:hypothetical protein
MLKNVDKLGQTPQFSIGADPEFFLVDKEGSLKSAIPIIEGTKDNQTIVDRGGLQRDNVAAEFSCEPQDSEDGFVGIIGHMLKQLSDHIKPLRLHAVASANFPKTELNHEEAKEFGCSPDYDCYSLYENEIDPAAGDATFRSCGGHIHVGVKNGLPKTLSNDASGHGKLLLVKAMDFFIGIPSIILDSDETAIERRQLYGKAGSHRPTNYGVEYRAVGNFWTKSPDFVRLTYRLTAMATTLCDCGVAKEYLEEVGETEIQRVINESDKKQAKKLTEKYIINHMKPETKRLFEKCKNTKFNINKEWNLI